VLDHLQDTGKSSKVAAIGQIRLAGKQPVIHILAHGFRNDETALRIEGAVIDALGLPSLTKARSVPPVRTLQFCFLWDRSNKKRSSRSFVMGSALTLTIDLLSPVRRNQRHSFNSLIQGGS
jgi:hypothetical protein